MRRRTCQTNNMKFLILASSRSPPMVQAGAFDPAEHLVEPTRRMRRDPSGTRATPISEHQRKSCRCPNRVLYLADLPRPSSTTVTWGMRLALAYSSGIKTSQDGIFATLPAPGSAWLCARCSTSIQTLTYVGLPGFPNGGRQTPRVGSFSGSSRNIDDPCPTWNDAPYASARRPRPAT